MQHIRTPQHFSQRGIAAVKPFVGVIAKATCVALIAGMVSANAVTAPAVPEGLKVPGTEELSIALQATGVQIYTCAAAKDDPARFDWTFKAPEANLFDSAGKKIGRHYAGPAWESDDGSKVIGELRAKDNGPDANAIPWLLLSAKSTSGNGVFGRTQSIQRLQTSGGKAPAEGCDQAQAGKEARVPYKATYYFYNAKP
jgi:hypothetical protein